MSNGIENGMCVRILERGERAASWARRTREDVYPEELVAKGLERLKDGEADGSEEEVADSSSRRAAAQICCASLASTINQCPSGVNRRLELVIQT